MSQYCCPDCDRVVWHDCEPLVFRRRRQLPRNAELRALRTVELEDAEYPSMEERWHGIFGDVAGGYDPPTPEEAKEETDRRRRAFGSGYSK